MQNFIELAKTCNMRQTADNLYISHQALSKQISTLEKEIGVKLFFRSNNKLSLTKAGERLLDIWEPALEMIEAGIFKALKVQGENKILIGIPEIPDILDAASLINDLTNGCWEEEYVVDSINNLIQLFKEQKIDIIILFENDIEIIKKPSCYHKIKRLNYGIICSSIHALASREYVTVPELQNETMYFIDTTNAKSMESYIYEQFATYGLKPKDMKRYRNWNNLEMALRSGNGIAMTYDMFLPRYNKGFSFIPVREKETKPSSSMV